VRDAAPSDVPAINGLYNALVPTTTVAWTEDLEPIAVREAWYAKQRHDDNPILVAEVDGALVGFASYDDFRDSTKWPGYRFTVEHTVHVAATHSGTGIGRALLESLIERASAQDVHVMIGAIDSANEGSIRFHERLGFTEVGRFTETGFKFGQWLDVVFLQRILHSTSE
jgi:phosphinothricin acetyltransferase